VGHSLGGAVVTHVANKGSLGSKMLGYAVLDVVEGSAMEALQHMQSYLASRPKTFPSLPAAIEWHIRSRTLRNPQSARASVPSLLLQTPDGKWTWRTELGSTEAYWENWFNGMSAKFLGGKGAKLLILAGTDRLDKELMIGQMQGEACCILVLTWVYLTSSRQIPAAGIPCSRSLSTRGPAREDGRGCGRVRQAQRSEHAGPPAKGIGPSRAGQEGVRCICGHALPLLGLEDIRRSRPKTARPVAPQASNDVMSVVCWVCVDACESFLI
jgi:hypothetical protein